MMARARVEVKKRKKMWSKAIAVYKRTSRILNQLIALSYHCIEI